MSDRPATRRGAAPKRPGRSAGKRSASGPAETKRTASGRAAPARKGREPAPAQPSVAQPAQDALERCRDRLAKVTEAAMVVSSAEGEHVFVDLVRALTRSLGVDAGMIAATIPGSPGLMRTLATCVDGRSLRSFDYELEHSPCRHMVGRATRFVAQGVNPEFSRKSLFHVKGFDAYAGRSLIDAEGRQIGLIVAMHRRPIEDRELTETLLHIFGVRAAAEMERRVAREAALTSERSYREIFEAAEDAIFVHDWDTGAILDVSPKASELYGYPRDELLRLRVGDISLDEPPYTEREANALIQRARTRSTPVRFAWRGRHRDGHLMWHEVTLKRAQIGGAPRVLAFVRDVTASRAAAEALQQREEQYRAIFDASADSLVLWDAQLNIVDVNPAFVRLYGFAREDIVGRNYAKHLPGGYIAERVALVKRALAGESCERMMTALRKDGTRFQVELRVLPILHRGMPHVLAIARDITERLHAEERLRASEARYRMLFATESDAIVLVDAQTLALHDANDAALAMYGYAREQFLRLTALDISIEPEATRAAIQEPTGAVNVPQRVHRRRDGSTFPVEIKANRLLLDGRTIVVAAIRDISERVARERAVSESEARLRAAIESAIDSVIALDAEGRIIEFNAAAERCFGHRRADVLGRNMAELVVPHRHRAAHSAGMAHFRATREGAFIGRRVEITALRADGSEFPVELAIGVAPSRDGDMFIGYLRDISDRKRAESERATLEAQLRQAQKMEAIGQLTGGIAHDFNNILASIMGYAVLAAERPAAAEDARLAEYLDQALNSCRRARDLIQQMLTFSRARTGEARSLVLGEVVREAVRMLRVTLPATLELDVEAIDAGCTVSFDPVQAQQVVLNLGINARDALGGHGRIALHVQRRHVEGATCASCRRPVAGSFVELEVANDGPAIPQAVRERMFEPFFSTKDAGKGTGMGLATVHRLVHEHRGHIVVDSATGRGTRFSVLLPEAGAAPEPAARLAAPSLAAPKMQGRILLVDDEGSVLGFMRELLSNWGLTVSAVGNGAEALAVLARDPGAFDVLLTDQTMPGMTGVELAEAAHRLRERLPTILYSGNLGEIEAHRERLGLHCTLHKPIEPEQLRTAVASCLQLGSAGA